MIQNSANQISPIEVDITLASDLSNIEEINNSNKRSYDKRNIICEEFMYAVIERMWQNIAHNEHNKTQNNEALHILFDMMKNSERNFDFSLLADAIKNIATFSSQKKLNDRNLSFKFDLSKLVIASGTFAMSKYWNIDDNDRNSHQLKHYSLLSVVVLNSIIQSGFSAITSYHGFDASICGHLANELAIAFRDVSRQLFEEYYNNKNKGNFLDSKSTSNLLENKFIINNAIKNITHCHHSGSKERSAGTLLNFTSMSSSPVRLTLSLYDVNQDFGSITAMVAPLISSVGKFLSFKAAKIREQNVTEIIDESLNILEEIAKLEDLNIDQVRKNLFHLGNLYKQERQEAIHQVNQSFFKSNIMSAKKIFNGGKDFLYGMPKHLYQFCYGKEGTLPTDLSYCEIERSLIEKYCNILPSSSLTPIGNSLTSIKISSELTLKSELTM